MNIQVKSTLLIIATFLLGMLLGALIAGRFFNTQLEKVGEFTHTEQGFKNKLYRIIEPTDSQKVVIDTILRQKSEKLKGLTETHQQNIQNLTTELVAELEPVLYEDQIKRLKNRLEQNRKRHEKRRQERRKKEKEWREQQSKEMPLPIRGTGKKAILSPAIKDSLAKNNPQVLEKIERVKALRQEQRQQMRELMDSVIHELDTTLTHEQKREVRQKVKQFRQQMQQQPVYQRPEQRQTSQPKLPPNNLPSDAAKTEETPVQNGTTSLQNISEPIDTTALEEQYEEEMNLMIDSFEHQVAPMLNPMQRAKLQKKVKNWRQRQMQRPKGMRNPMRKPGMKPRGGGGRK